MEKKSGRKQAGNGEEKRERKREKEVKKGIESSDFVYCCTLLIYTMRTLDRTSDVTQI